MKNENDRFFEVVDFLKENKQLKSYVELAEVLETNKSGVSDIKASRKKLTIENIRSLKKSYPSVNLNYIISGDGPILDNAEFLLNRLNEKAYKDMLKNDSAQQLKSENENLKEKLIGKESLIKTLQKQLEILQSLYEQQKLKQHQTKSPVGTAGV